MTERILIVGASGYIGNHLVPHLAARGHEITATGRALRVLKKRAWGDAENITLKQLDLISDDITPLLEDIDIVIFLVHGMAHGHDFIDYELNATQQLRKALDRSQVKQVIYLGALQPQTDAASEHLVARQKTGEELRKSKVPIVELRAGIVVGPGSAAFEVMRDFIYHLPLLFTPRWVNSTSSPIALDNLLYYITQLVDNPTTGNPIYDIAGPEVLTYQSQMMQLGDAMGKKVHLIKLPFLTPEMTAHFFGIITSVPSNIAKALVSGLRYHLPADDKAIRERFPQTLITYRDAVTKTLEQEEDVVRSDVWGFDPDALQRWHKGYGYYPKNAGFSHTTHASAEQLWRIVNQLGEEPGYFYANALWRIREWMDYAIGGSARKRQRTAKNQLAIGDYIDSWKVIAVEENRFLSLLFGMKAPGLGRLEFTISDEGDKRRLDIRAWWHPAGFPGLLYWFAMMPAHLFIFKGMVKAVCERAEQSGH
ncbi:DUF2867 domain-containing protein [Thaumasiovibrio subtropicus]|uniref:DUF2867 domain-containing protein n=1 Tax=Thaumasiovibrio subtropicus TaxID=1891207 RepID=UPI000B35862A|nr:DUF2867 domain-containing protein [Thaumasiovibrio subtropicus]